MAQAQSKSKQNSKVKIIRMMVIIFILIGLYFVLYSYYKIGNNRYTNSAQIEAYINPINTRVSAYITDIRFVEHLNVRKGDTLVLLDNREILTQLGQAKAALMAAEAAKQVALNTVQTATNNISTAAANSDAGASNIELAKAKHWNIVQNYKRYENLLKDQAVTQAQFDQVKTEYEASLQQINATTAQYKALNNSKNTSVLTAQEAQARILLNEAEIERAKNALAMAELNLSYCVITAPHDGVMGRRAINIGQLLTPSQQVAVIVDTKNMWVTANYREKQMELVKLNDKVTINVDALGGKEFEGKITAISGATGARYASIPVDNSTGNFIKVQQRIPVRIEFTENNSPEDLKALKAGMNLDVTIN